jgi:hypothetical protein
MPYLALPLAFPSEPSFQPQFSFIQHQVAAQSPDLDLPAIRVLYGLDNGIENKGPPEKSPDAERGT